MIQAAGRLLGKQNTQERELAFREIIPYRGDNSLMHSNRSFARPQSATPGQPTSRPAPALPSGLLCPSPKPIQDPVCSKLLLASPQSLRSSEPLSPDLSPNLPLLLA